MTREEIIDFCDMKAQLEPENEDVFNEIIKALEQEPQSFKWCTDCKEYDQEKHCCHRYSKVIRDAVSGIGQEPFINKPCVSEKVCEHDKQMVLDKLRAEIEEPLKINQGLNTESAKAQAIALSWVLEVIDKYRAESEG